MKSIHLAVVLLLWCMPALADGTALTPEQRDAEFAKLQEITAPGSYALPLSKSHLTLAEGQSLLIGKDAARYDELSNGLPSPETEAVLFNADGSQVYFIYSDAGHVEDDDWSDVDADDFLKQMKEGDAVANKERRKQGITPFYNDGWREKPTFSAASHTAYWALSLHNDDGERWLNVTAIRLGRTGYETVIWAGQEEQFQSASATLQPTLDNHSYDPGARYADFVSGDKTAGYGIGALAATVLGVKLGKGFLAGIIAFLVIAWKKILVVVAAIFGGAIFRKKKKKEAAPPPPAGP